MISFSFSFPWYIIILLFSIFRLLSRVFPVCVRCHHWGFVFGLRFLFFCYVCPCRLCSLGIVLGFFVRRKGLCLRHLYGFVFWRVVYLLCVWEFVDHLSFCLFTYSLFPMIIIARPLWYFWILLFVFGGLEISIFIAEYLSVRYVGFLKFAYLWFRGRRGALFFLFDIGFFGSFFVASYFDLFCFLFESVSFLYSYS